MSIRKYLAFAKVVEKGSVTAAAAELGISQSGLTQLLNSLEDELGLTLMQRNRSGIKLTEEGTQLLPLVLDTLSADKKIRELAASLSGEAPLEEGPVIRIGSFTSVAVNWLPEIIRKYSVEAPEVRIELIDGGYNNIEKSFSEHPIDFAFVRLPLDFKCKTLPLYNDRLLAVLPQDFDTNKLIEKPDAAQRKDSQTGLIADSGYSCPISLFHSEPVVSLIDTVDRDAKTVFKAAGIVPNIRYRVEDDYALLAMVEKGLGIAIVPELMLKGNKRDVRIVELNPPSFRMIGIAFPDYEHVSSNAMKFVEFTQKFIS